MKSSCLKWLGVRLLAAAAVGLIGCFLCAQCQPASELRQASISHQTDSPSQPSQVPVCGVAAKDVDNKKLELAATKGKPLQFKCAPSQKLGPAGTADNKLDNVYQYLGTGGTKNCQTGNSTSLASLVEDAKLTSTTTSSKLRSDSQPVYTFVYNSEPDQAKYLCYTCDTSGAVGGVPTRGGTAETQCTIYIEVPAKPSTPPSTSPSTTAPGSTSDSRAMTASIATATGAFLAVMLRLYHAG